MISLKVISIIAKLKELNRLRILLV